MLQRRDVQRCLACKSAGPFVELLDRTVHVTRGHLGRVEDRLEEDQVDAEVRKESSLAKNPSHARTMADYPQVD